MATSEKISSRLQLRFEDGVDEVSGELILKSKSFNNVKTDATADQLLGITNALVPLQQKPLFSVERDDSSIITEE